MGRPLFRFLGAAGLALAGLSGCRPATDATPIGPPGFPAKLEFQVQPADAQSGVSIAPSIQVAIVDAGGAVVTAATNRVTLGIAASSGASLSGDRSADAVGGIATFTNLDLDGKAGAYALIATSDNLSDATSTAFTLAPGPLSRLVFDSFPGGASTGAALPSVIVREEDGWGNVVATASDTVTMTLAYNPQAALFSGGTTVVAVAGVATFTNLHIDKPDSNYHLIASVTRKFVTTSDRLIVVPYVGTASRLAFQAMPLRAATGFALAPVQVALLDPSGSLVYANDTVQVTVHDASGSSIATASAVAALGVASFSDLRINQAGAGYTLSATATGRTSATSAAFPVIAPMSAQPPAALAAGEFVTCAASTSGPRCWGDDLAGMLGDNRPFSSLSPIAVSGGLHFASIETARLMEISQEDGITGNVQSCGLTSAGAAWCWGEPLAGSSDRFTSAPVLVPGGLSFSSLTLARSDACGLTVSGAAYCWGTNDDNELGNGRTYTGSSTPVAVNGGITFSALGAGAKHVCGLDTAGAAWCWGILGDTTGRPVRVTGAPVFTSLASGGWHSCGLTAAGAAWCWGSNFVGQLGDGSTTDRPQPVAVSGGHQFTIISGGMNQTCALDAGGAAWCWGSGSGPTPAAVPGGLAFASIDAGNRGTCGLTSAGKAFCWGDNSSGELGDGTTTSSATPVPVSGSITFAAIQAGALSGCGLANDGAAWCWGDNGDGELGDGHPLSSYIPTSVSGGMAFNQFAAGTWHSCALTAAGAAWCWGIGPYLGSGSSGISGAVPVAVAGGQTFSQLTIDQTRSCGLTPAGSVWCWGFTSGQSAAAQPIHEANGFSFAAIATASEHTCGLEADGSAWCWGARNDYGQLGNAGAASLSPVAVSGGFSFISIVAGQSHTCGLTPAGEAFCWGLNYAQDGAGFLGAGLASYFSTMPVRVSGNHVFAALSAAGDHTCGLTTAGEGWCWGYNWGGLLGDGTTANSNVPVMVAGSVRFASINAGSSHTCGVTAGGEAWCWGDNDWKELGAATTGVSGGSTISATPVLVSGGFQFSPTAPASVRAIVAAPRARPVAAPHAGPAVLASMNSAACAANLPIALKARYRATITRLCGPRR
ncbi:MAG TPA: hypothetical protein VGI92_02000 [Gemmatimonadales bacterium]|jgi:alpha-tubulin suppressor-like RCC1 family protein